jgi:hypothetical protein
MADTTRNLPAKVCEQIIEIDWADLTTLPAMLTRPTDPPLRIWVAARELAPLAVQHLIDYRRGYPELFSLAPQTRCWIGWLHYRRRRK